MSETVKRKSRSGKAIMLKDEELEAQRNLLRQLGQKHGVDVDVRGTSKSPYSGKTGLVRRLNEAIRHHSLPMKEIGEERVHEAWMGRSAPLAIAKWNEIPPVTQ